MVVPRSPGVFIEEVPPQRVPQGVSPSNMGIVGFTVQGITDRAILVESFDEYQRKFGGFTNLSLVPLSVQTFFENGGRRAFVVRVVPAGSLTATVNVDAPAKWTINAISAGAWGNDLRFRFAGNRDFLDTSGPLPVWKKFDVSVLQLDPNTGLFLTQELFQQVDLSNATDPAFLTTVVNDEQRGSQLVRVVAGLTGTPNALVASSVTGEVIGTGDGVTTHFTGTLANPRVFEGSLTISVTTPPLTVTDDTFGHLIGAVNPAGVNTINYDTGEFDVTFNAAPGAGQPITAAYIHLNNQVTFTLAGGTNGSGVITRSQVSAPGLAVDKRGIFALDAVEDIVNIIIPDFAGDAQVMQDQVDFVDARQDRFAILTTPPDLTVLEAISFVRNTFARNSRNTAIYYPWVKMVDRATNGIRTVPPLGHLAGVYARTDLRRTVAKAPAGIDDGRLEGIFATERKLDRADLDNLTESRINALFSSETTGDIVFGVRTMSLDSAWKFINVRRLFIFVEKVLFRETQFAIFENNGPDLWARITQTITGILTSMFNARMFAGTTLEEAFFVVCDETNNTPQDVENGIVNVDVGIAPLKPAEFILIRIQQKQVQPTTT